MKTFNDKNNAINNNKLASQPQSNVILASLQPTRGKPENSVSISQPKVGENHFVWHNVIWKNDLPLTVVLYISNKYFSNICKLATKFVSNTCKLATHYTLATLLFILKSIHYKRHVFWIFTSQKSNTFVEIIQNVIGMARIWTHEQQIRSPSC